MSKLTAEISISLDGFVAGPNPSLDDPLGEGGELLHEWVVATKSFRETHGMEGGEENADSEVMRESIEDQGALIMGRRMFSGGEGPWESDPKAGGWWGDDPPFRVPVFVLTSHARDPLRLGESTFHFVTDGIEAAFEQARAAAGDRNVAIGGGASVIQQYLDAGLLDEIQIHFAPVLLGGGTRLFDGVRAHFEPMRVAGSPAVTHVRYRVVK